MKVISLYPSKRELKNIERINRFDLWAKPYWPYWEEWKQSKACFLNEREITIIEYFDKYLSFQQISEDLNIPNQTAKLILHRAMMKLEWYYKHFKEWTEDIVLEKSG